MADPCRQISVDDKKVGIIIAGRGIPQVVVPEFSELIGTEDWKIPWA